LKLGTFVLFQGADAFFFGSPRRKEKSFAKKKRRVLGALPLKP
jgi:hypothetical protein